MRNRKAQSKRDRKNHAERAERHAQIDKTGARMFTYSHAEMCRRFTGFKEPKQFDENGVEKRYVVHAASSRLIPDFGE